jgi:hypothetical protein
MNWEHSLYVLKLPFPCSNSTKDYKIMMVKMVSRTQYLWLLNWKMMNLYNTGIQENWQELLKKLRNKLNLPSLDISECTFYNYYIDNINMQLQNTEFSKRGKLLFYSKIRKRYELQDYLKYSIVKV